MVDAAGLAGFRAGSKGVVEGTWEQDNILAGKPALSLRAGLQPSGAAVLLVAGQKTDLVIYSCVLSLSDALSTSLCMFVPAVLCVWADVCGRSSMHAHAPVHVHAWCALCTCKQSGRMCARVCVCVCGRE